TPTLAAMARWLRPSSHFCLRISFAFRMDSRSVAIAPPSEADGVSDYPASLSANRPLLGRGSVAPIRRARFRLRAAAGPNQVIGMAVFGDRDAVFGDRHGPFSVITMDRFRRSPWGELRSAHLVSRNR